MLSLSVPPMSGHCTPRIDIRRTKNRRPDTDSRRSKWRRVVTGAARAERDVGIGEQDRRFLVLEKAVPSWSGALMFPVRDC